MFFRRSQAASLYCAVMVSLCFCAVANADDQETNNVDSKILVLKASQLTPSAVVAAAAAPPSLSGVEPYKSGQISVADAQRLINTLRGAQTADDRVTIIHILRWNNADHSVAKFQKWYVYDPSPPKGNFYWTSAQTRFQSAIINGKTKFRLIYIHLNFDLNNNHGESFKTNLASHQDEPTHPVSYGVTVKKQQTQFVKDLISLLTILGAYTPQAAPAAVDPEVGYFSVYEFDSQFKTSSITVTASHNDPAKAGGGEDVSGGSKSQQIATQTYANEGPSWIGLSFAVPLTSYKDLSYSQTNGSITTNTIDRQNIYAAVDFYLPPVQPGMTAFRYIPHPFFGMPIKKQPLRNTTAGLGMGWRWLEPFGSVVFNVQQRKTASGSLTNHLVFKGAWGLKMSVSDVAKALKSNSSKSSSKNGSSGSGAKDGSN